MGYNTGNDGFVYKDNYQHSSWLSMIEQNLILSQVITNRNDSFFSVSIDKRQLFDAKLLLEKSLKIFDFVNAIVNVNNPKGRSDQKHLPTAHENLLLFATDGAVSYGWEPADKVLKRYKKQDKDGIYREIDLRKTGDNDLATDRPNMYYAFAYNEETGDLFPVENDHSFSEEYFLIYPMKDQDTKGCWRWELKTAKKNLDRLIAKYQPNKQQWSIFEKDYLGEDERVFPTSVWDEKAFNSERGTETFINLGFLKDDFPRPKPVGFLMYLLEHLARDANYVLDYFAGSGTTAHAVINLNREDNGQRKYTLVEMGDYFDTVLKPRIQKVVYAQNWKDGKPKERDSGISHCFKYLRLESYEDTLNNLELNPVNSQFLRDNQQLQREYLLHYLLDIETKGSQSLLNIDNFANPTDYRLKIKIPGTDEYQEKAIDLIETFNYLIGLRVISIDAPQRFRADLERQIDPELPDRQDGKLIIKGKLKSDPNGQWWFRKIEGTVPKNSHTPNDGLTENVLIVWRNLTGDLEQDNLILDEWFQQNRINPKDFEYDIIYVNGSNNLPNLLRQEDHWKVRLIEETFHQKMWDMGGF